MFVKRIFILAFSGLLFGAVLGIAQTYPGPYHEKTVSEARKALRQLGPERGALDISGSVTDILFAAPLDFGSTSLQINQALKDLGAKTVDNEVQISLSGDVLFEFDKAEIKSEAEASLSKLAGAIKELGKKTIIIEGHTDNKGSENYNLTLSRERAKAVKEWFINKGHLEDYHFTTRGYGETKPVASNTNPDGSDNPKGRARNRRVEIRIKNE